MLTENAFRAGSSCKEKVGKLHRKLHRIISNSVLQGESGWVRNAGLGITGKAPVASSGQYLENSCSASARRCGDTMGSA